VPNAARHFGLVAALSTALAGCAGDPALRAELGALKRRLDDAQRRQVQADKRLEEMEDRVFLLTDQLESAKVAQARAVAPPPRLPVVTLRPAPDGEEGDSSGVEYRGEAAIAGRPTKIDPPPRLLTNDSVVRSTADDASAASGSTDERAQARAKVLGLRRARPTATATTNATTTAAAASPPPPVIPPSGDNLGVAPAPALRKVLGSSTAPTTDERAAVAADPARAYRAAYDELRRGHHDAAAGQFREFLRRWPEHDYADNAAYWLGECYYDRRAFADAKGAFAEVVSRYPTGNKAPDAMVKLALSLIALGDVKKGKELLAQVPVVYPRTDAARVAAARLGELSSGEVPR
jgi:tol-pal system protein YbgF